MKTTAPRKQRTISPLVASAARRKTADIKVNGSSSLSRKLESLGRLPDNFNGNDLVPHLSHNNEKIRMLAAINLGKVSDMKFVPLLEETARKDSSTIVRREAVSAIGRMRNPEVIPILIRMTRDPDPKVVLQALRGLLAFKKKDRKIQAVLKRLSNHKNEIIKEVIECEQSIDSETPKAREQHTESPDFMKNLVVQGDVLSVLKKTPAESIHLTFTSPPYYNARDYSIYSSYKE